MQARTRRHAIVVRGGSAKFNGSHRADELCAVLLEGPLQRTRRRHGGDLRLHGSVEAAALGLAAWCAATRGGPSLPPATCGRALQPAAPSLLRARISQSCGNPAQTWLPMTFRTHESARECPCSRACT